MSPFGKSLVTATFLSVVGAVPVWAQGPPTAPEIEKLFQYPSGTGLTEIDATSSRPPQQVWGRRYENLEISYYSVSIAVFPRGTYLTAARKKELEKMIRWHNRDKESLRLEQIHIKSKEPHPAQLRHKTFYTFRTIDHRVGYNYSLGTLGGVDEITVLPSFNGKSDLIIVVSYTLPKDVSDPERKRPNIPSKSAFEVLPSLEKLLLKNQQRPARFPIDPNLDAAPAAPPK